MPHVVHIPRCFDPTYSLFGRLLRRRVGDERRAASFHILALAALLLALTACNYTAWMFFRPDDVAGLSGPTLYVGLSQAGLWIAGLGVFVIGFRPAVTVTVHAGGLEIRQGTDHLAVAAGQIQKVTTISDLLFHRHYSRYAGTRAFVNRMEPDLLLLHVDGGHVVLGLPQAEREAVARHLTRQGGPHALSVS